MKAGKVKISGDVHVRRFHEELVLLDLARGEYFGLNDVGALAVEHIAAGKTREEIIDEVIATFDVDHARAADDYDALLEELLSRGLVVPAG